MGGARLDGTLIKLCSTSALSLASSTLALLCSPHMSSLFPVWVVAMGLVVAVGRVVASHSRPASANIDYDGVYLDPS
jgi:hypothetical protein